MVIIAVYGTLLALLAGAVFFRPSRAVAGVLCLYPLKQWAMASDVWLLTNRTLTNYAMAVIVAFAVLLTFFRRGGRMGGYTKVGWLTFSLYGLAAASYFWTVSQPNYLEQWGLWWPYVITFLPLVPLLIRDADDAHHALIATMAFAAVLMPLLMFTVTWRYRHIVFVAYIRTAGAEGNPLAIASMCGYAMLAGILMTFRPGLSLFWQIVRWSVVILGFGLMVRSGSRGPLIAVMLAALVFLPMSRRIRDVGTFFAVGGTAILILSIAYWAFEQYAEGGRWDFTAMGADMASSRLGTTIAVLTAWVDGGPLVWLAGYGNSGSFLREINSYYPEVVPSEVLAEEGLLGFALYLAIVGITLSQIPRVYRVVREHRFERGLFAALSAMFVFELLQTFKGGSLISNTGCFIFAIILSRFGAYVTREMEAAQQERLLQPPADDYQPAPGYGYWPEGATAAR
jgi:hypothetical protein